MRKLGFISAVFMLSIILQSCRHEEAQSATKGYAVMKFSEWEYKFGDIPFGGDGDCEFLFLNTGSSPLVLTNVKSTCGCTIPEWPDKPIPAGKEGAIRVSYDTKKVGSFRKSIYIYSNASNGVQRLYVSGSVLPHDEETVN